MPGLNRRIIVLLCLTAPSALSEDAAQEALGSGFDLVFSTFLGGSGGPDLGTFGPMEAFGLGTVRAARRAASSP